MAKEKKNDRFLEKDFDFHKARKVTPAETETFRKMIENTLGVKRTPRGRPRKSDELKFESISIRIHPKALAWAKREAKKRGIGYQTLINEVLLKKSAA